MPKDSTGKSGYSAVMQQQQGLPSEEKSQSFNFVERHWGSNRTNSNQSQIPDECGHADLRSSSISMLDRWKGETMTEQPYNTVGAVPNGQHNSGGAEKTSTSCKDWNISYQDPKPRS